MTGNAPQADQPLGQHHDSQHHDSQHQDGPRIIEQRGLYFDELEEGVLYAHRPGRTVTEADNVLFTTLTMNTQALHLDAAWSAGQPFGQRLVNSMFTLATVVGQSVAQLTQGTIIAQLGLTDVSFPHPLDHGRAREPDVLGQRLHRQAAILLQRRDDLLIERIDLVGHRFRSPANLRKYGVSGHVPSRVRPFRHR